MYAARANSSAVKTKLRARFSRLNQSKSRMVSIINVRKTVSASPPPSLETPRNIRPLSHSWARYGRPAATAEYWSTRGISPLVTMSPASRKRNQMSLFHTGRNAAIVPQANNNTTGRQIRYFLVRGAIRKSDSRWSAPGLSGSRRRITSQTTNALRITRSTAGRKCISIRSG